MIRSFAYRSKQRQCGSVVWVILLVLLVAVGGAWMSNQNRLQKKQDQQAQQQAANKKEQERRADAERQELERRVAKDKEQRDVLSASLKGVDDLLARWEDAVRVAGTSSRIALPGPVAALQATRREADQLTVPPCMDEAKTNLVQSMNSTIEGFLVFMRNELKLGDTLAQIHFEEAAMHLKAFKAGRAACPQ